MATVTALKVWIKDNPRSLPTSVTRVGENSPLWQSFKRLWLFFEGLFCIGQKFDTSWAKNL